jgi:hypothetical protein
MESQCLVDTKIFLKIINHFNHFLVYFHFYYYIMIYIFFAQIYSKITSYEIKNVVSLAVDFFVF